jgi:hypothetical protein
MPKYLIEVPHGAAKAECEKAIKIFLSTGSHFLTHADWGCTDGVHKAWITADVDSKEEARMIVPPAYRSHAEIVTVVHFGTNASDEIVAKHHEK